MAPTLSRPLAELPDPLPVPPLPRGRAFRARVRTPGSKSLTNRALLLGALAAGESTLRGALAGADDTERMAAALRALGAGVEVSGTTVRIRGVRGRWTAPRGGVRLDIASAGTAARFLAAAALLSREPVTIDGSARMRERPIGELAEALLALGARVEFPGSPGRPPVRVTGPAELPRGAVVTLGEAPSSQFVSALLLVAPWLPEGLTVRMGVGVPSRSYVSMTLGLLEALGASVRASEDLRVLRVGGGGVPAFDYEVEPDASGATYFWGAAALVPGAVALAEGLGPDSLQGDAEFPGVLARMGATVVREDSGLGVRGPAALAPVMADMSDMPDAAITLAVVAAFAGGPSVIRGLGTLRVKESDRIAALKAELAKVGVRVDTDVLGDPDSITVTPPAAGVGAGTQPVVLETYDDHRMAMGLALIGLRRANVQIASPRCVGKTYPGFWAELARLYE